MKTLLLFLSLLLVSTFAIADTVVPVDKVENHVNIRMSPDGQSEVVGRLKKGDSATLIATQGAWHEVEFNDGVTGYISADWTEVITATESAEREATDAEPAADAVDEIVDELVTEDLVEEVVADAVVSEEASAAASAAVEAAADVAADEGMTEEVEAETVAGTVEPEPETEPKPEPAPEPEPAVELALKGSKNFLMRFRDAERGVNSQIYDNGNQVGVGTTEPKQRLEVNGSIQIHDQNSSVAGLMITQIDGDTGYIMHNRASTLTIGAGSKDRITVDRDGNVGIGVPRPDYPLEMESGAHVTAGGVWTDSSSRARKENIQALSASEAMAAFAELRPVRFNYKADRSESYLGFIAEDVPDLVAMQDRNSLSPMDMVALLTKVVQEQNRRIADLEARLDDR